MHSIPVDLSFTDANRCHRVLHAVSRDGRGWHVRALLEGRVFTRDCSDWQHVERTRVWLPKRIRTCRPPTPAPPLPLPNDI